MSNVALTAISVAMGLFYVFFGTLKLAPVISEEMYRSMRKTFIRTYGSFPLSQLTGWNPNPHLIRRVFGTTEVVGGLLLLAGSSILQDISAGTLLILMLFHLFGIWNASGDPRSASNSVVFALLLTCRFVIRAQSTQNNQGTRIRTFRNDVDEDLRQSVALLRKGLLELKEASKRLEESRTNGQPIDKRGSE
ncbi:Transmembrane protein 35 [Paragonimus skrjabini miyazakii]|uniref:Novel acetylcholine receptor chaperone n=1 Tax=Paragonimus skrjabini miyazakii TaxID=59628 RepID=A0A8S9YYF6_9TREM|nr:Transmembrane protein 35 [Paragonimus skrjabini miyazakii]